jgi:hypothetical protein
MHNERDINQLLRLDILHVNPTPSDRRVTKRIICPEDGTHDASQSPENAVTFNDEPITNLLIEQGTDIIYPDNPDTEPPNSPDEPFPDAA